MSFTLGNLPERVRGFHGDALDNYFRVARGRSAQGADDHAALLRRRRGRRNDQVVRHQLPLHRPRVRRADTQFKLDRLASPRAACAKRGAWREGQAGHHRTGDLSVARQGEGRFGQARAAAAPAARLRRTARHAWRRKASSGCRSTSRCSSPNSTPTGATPSITAYDALSSAPRQAAAGDLLRSACRTTWTSRAKLPVAGLHIDAINAPRRSRAGCIDLLPSDKRRCRSASINGRNIWKTDLNAALDWLRAAARSACGDRLWIAPSCSLLHVPVDLDSEQKLDAEVKSWLAFALQKLDELTRARRRAEPGTRVGRRRARRQSRPPSRARRNSPRVHNPAVKAAIAKIDAALGERKSAYAATRRQAGRTARSCRTFPTTTIGSFPQTAEIRQARSQFKAGELDEAGYKAAMQARNRAQRARAGSAGAGRARARRSRAQRHGRILRRAARRLRIQPVRLGAVLRLALREAADPVRRHQPPEGR